MSHSEAITAHVKPSHVPPITTQAGGNGSDPDRRVPRWPESAGVGPGEHMEASSCGKRPDYVPSAIAYEDIPIEHHLGVRSDSVSRDACIELERRAERIAFLETELAEARLAADRWRKQATDAEQELASDREWYEGELTSARLTASEALDERDAVMADRDRWVERIKTLEAKLASVREVVR